MRRKETNFGVYALDTLKPSACQYYRIIVPVVGAEAMGLVNGFLDHGTFDVESRQLAFFNSEIALFYAVAGAHVDEMIRIARSMRPGLNDTGDQVLFPPSLVYDIDDNVDYVHPQNSVYVALGTRDSSGRLLKPGEQVATVDANGDPIVLWVDKETMSGDGQTFDIARNLENVRTHHRTAKAMDGVSVPSPHLAKYYREVHGCDEVYVFPNSVVPEHHPQPRLMPHEGVRILWQGGMSHFQDWFPLRDAVREVARRYPQAKFVIWGTIFPWIRDAIPPEQIELHDWVPYDAYKAYRAIIDVDINLCPLNDTLFNRCKSAIKWYESLLTTNAEATLAAKLPPYSDEMVDGETGLLYSSSEEFVEKLGILIENAELRKKLHAGGKEWMLANRHYTKTVPELFEWWKSIKDRQALALGA